MENQQTVSKKQNAFAMTIGPLGALAMKADKVMLDFYLAVLIVVALFGYLGVQAWLEARKKQDPS